MSENGQGGTGDISNGEGPERFYLTKLHLLNFTAFREIDIDFSPGVNVFIGENATGKTHLLKVMYACCKFDPSKDVLLETTIGSYFYCTSPERWNLRNKDAGDFGIGIALGTSAGEDWKLGIRVNSEPPIRRTWTDKVEGLNLGGSEAVFIPSKEMLSHAKGFLEDYERFHLPFEKYYADILVYAGSSLLRQMDVQAVIGGLNKLGKIIEGRVEQIEGTYYLVSEDGFKLEMTLVAEGLRKFALLWRLYMNASIRPGNLLFIDEPEANLNPKLIGEMAGIILEIQRLGVQVFLATHSYLLVKELELQAEAGRDELLFHSLYREPEPRESYIKCQSAVSIAKLEQNPILDAYEAAYDRELDQTMERLRNV